MVSAGYFRAGPCKAVLTSDPSSSECERRQNQAQGEHRRTPNRHLIRAHVPGFGVVAVRLSAAVAQFINPAQEADQQSPGTGGSPDGELQETSIPTSVSSSPTRTHGTAVTPRPWGLNIEMRSDTSSRKVPCMMFAPAFQYVGWLWRMWMTSIQPFPQSNTKSTR